MRGHSSIWLFSGRSAARLWRRSSLGTGLWELGHPLAHPPVLHHLHAPIWWGALMLVAGLFYTIRFRHHR